MRQTPPVVWMSRDAKHALTAHRRPLWEQLRRLLRENSRRLFIKARNAHQAEKQLFLPPRLKYIGQFRDILQISPGSIAICPVFFA